MGKQILSEYGRSGSREIIGPQRGDVSRARFRPGQWLDLAVLYIVAAIARIDHFAVARKDHLANCLSTF